MSIILIIHIFTSFFMTGLCWFVQIAHYPLFHEIDLEGFPKYERKNVVTAYVTVPTMIIEGLSGLYLLYLDQSAIYLWNIFFLLVIGLSTLIYQVPIHLKLMQTASTKLITKLIRTNWIRTLSWTVRAGLLAYLLANYLPS